jgi:transposase-like protein
MECRHGRVPFDPSPVCGCFPIEQAQEVPAARRFPPHVRRRAVQLYVQGVSSRELASRFGACQRTVLDWVRAAGVPVRGRGRPWPEKRKRAA